MYNKNLPPDIFLAGMVVFFEFLFYCCFVALVSGYYFYSQPMLKDPRNTVPVIVGWIVAGIIGGVTSWLSYGWRITLKTIKAQQFHGNIRRD